MRRDSYFCCPRKTLIAIRQHFIFFCAVPGILALFAPGCRNTGDGQSMAAGVTAAQPYPVFTTKTYTTTLRSEYPATLQGQQNIEIRPKIDGYIEHIYIDEGATVKKGQLLFSINAPQYEQDVRNALAAINSAEADVNTAKLQVEKTRPLVDKGIISEYELKSDEQTLKVKEAVLLQAKTTLANARTNLSYTTVTSPVDGVAGMIPYKLGSLVSSTTAQPLTTISNIAKVYAYFSMNEKQLLEFSRQYKGSTVEAKLKQLPPVALILSDKTEYPEKGRVEAMSGLISSETGAATFRATFPNPVGLIHSGGSAVIAIPVKLNNALLVPQRATYELQGKRFVYKVDGDKVTSTEITTLPDAAGQYFVVTDGLRPGDKIVFEAATPIPDGTAIAPQLQPDSAVYKDIP
jgi:membrane fusion protein (multidrug efflux system)